jgi:subtilase family serine protease
VNTTTRARARRAAAAAGAAAALSLGLACSPSGSTPAAVSGTPASNAAPTPVTPAVTPTPTPTPLPGVGTPPPTGLSPAQLAVAYNLSPLRQRGIDGTGQTIVIVDSFGSPTIAADLAGFDSAFGLPAPPSLRIIAPAGPVPAYRDTTTRAGWASETSMDVEWAHVMAPGAAIVLAETPTAETEGITGFPQISTALNYVLSHHLGQVISESFGATEQTFSSTAQLLAQRGPYELAQRDHVTVLAASGDDGASGDTNDQHTLYDKPVVEWPASDPLVTAVGGTELKLSAGGQRTAPDIAWNEGGGGRSAIFARPSYQDGVASVTGSHRGIPDISMDASCSSAVPVYGSYLGGGGWQTSCGTSLATPLMAGLVALADQVAGHALGLINPALYKMLAAHSPGLTDVVSGDNSLRTGDGTPMITGFSARPGYDLVSGVGTVNAAQFVPELARGG